MKSQIFARRLLAGAALTLVSAPAFAQTPVSLGRTTYTQDFNGLAASGTSSALPAGWALSEQGTSTVGKDNLYAAGTGSSNQGNTYSFGSAGSSDRALGTLTSGTATPLQFGAFFTNNLGGTIESISLEFFGEQWRLSNGAGDKLSFEYSTDATALSNGTWTMFSALDFAAILSNGTSAGAALNGNLAANRKDIFAMITGLSIAQGGSFAFRWTDLDVGASDQGLGVDDLTLTAGLQTPPTSPVPEPAAWAMMIGGFGLAGGALRRRASRVTFA
ncbi:PEPxxWA-CTERM sorting domain-containing protein [Sphingomonas sp. JC676]|uniref:PEPxxWA-CTERM sorting domain-containing protein n=1 Tax=Sphingomonas sp. JC676 TaxID=2768065 RepID=UPI00165851D8|nr:PEPxxWA-CTERM sorting domain-containing protein [Sphingomonas sp. JC676]MBC9034690.1 PEPxxWA-CTERM sorting domain-containing protein [Sphingomonas sp. JC676]